MTFDEAFFRLSRSKFRSRFHLAVAELLYIEEKGWMTIRRHAEDFVRQKLAPAHPVKDGRQTPMRGHPVFIAQHATATCCRGCMNRWWKVPLNVELSSECQAKAVNLILEWIRREMKASDSSGRLHRKLY